MTGHASARCLHIGRCQSGPVKTSNATERSLISIIRTIVGFARLEPPDLEGIEARSSITLPILLVAQLYSIYYSAAIAPGLLDVTENCSYSTISGMKTQ